MDETAEHMKKDVEIFNVEYFNTKDNLFRLED